MLEGICGLEQSTGPSLGPIRQEDKYRALTTTTTTRSDFPLQHDLIISAITLAHKNSRKLERFRPLTRLCIVASLAFVLACTLVAYADAGSSSRSLDQSNSLVNSIATHRKRQNQHHQQEFQDDQREQRTPASYHQLTSQDLASTDQLDEPTFISSMSEESGERQQSSGYTSGIRGQSGVSPPGNNDNAAAADDDDEPILLDNFSELMGGSSRARQRRGSLMSRAAAETSGYWHPTTLTTSSDESRGQDQPADDEEVVAAQDSRDGATMPDGAALYMGGLDETDHNSRLKAMRDMFERRQMSASGVASHHNGNNNNNNNNQNRLHRPHRSGAQQQPQLQPNSQELSPISIGLDPPFAMPSPFQMGDGAAPPMPLAKPQMVDGNDGGVGPLGGGGFPFGGANPLPHLLGFQSGAFDGPQRGDQSAHSQHHHHAAAAPAADVDANGPGAGGGAKVWPKIFRFTDGRINLSDFEKQKKIRLSSKNQHGENHIESAPIMFDNRQLKRKSFLILHGGVFPS